MPILIIGPTPCLTLSVTPISPSFEHLPRQCPEGHQKGGPKTPKAGPVLECVAHGHAIAVCQIVEAATRVVTWSVVKGNRASSCRSNTIADQRGTGGACPASANFGQRLNSIGRIRTRGKL